MKIKELKKILVVLSLFLTVLFSSCGLPVYHILYPPVNAIPPKDLAEERVFRFTTADKSNSQYASGVYLGVDIYYRIYDSETECNADIQQIKSANTEFSHTGFNKMVSLNYAKMTARPQLHSHSDILLHKTTENYMVSVRLFTEGTEENEYKAGFSSEPTLEFPLESQPIRSTTTSFDLVAVPPVPKTDTDYKYSEESTTEPTVESNVYYVAAFAVSVGRDGSFAPHYSSLLPLETIKIPKS